LCGDSRCGLGKNRWVEVSGCGLSHSAYGATGEDERSELREGERPETDETTGDKPRHCVWTIPRSLRSGSGAGCPRSKRLVRVGAKAGTSEGRLNRACSRRGPVGARRTSRWPQEERDPMRGREQFDGHPVAR
jgi:hypothetical protein